MDHRIGPYAAAAKRRLEAPPELRDKRAVMSDMQKPSPWIARWLELVIAMVAAIVVVGGATRMTGSGLSITEWQPIIGTLPPLNDADWQAAFGKYQQSSQFKLQNSAMTMAEFHFIFWWEWAHRLLGRMIGLAVALPLAVLYWRRALPQGLGFKLFALLVLIGLQGALGWFMVASGLVDRVSVTQYRLSAHLTLACLIFAYVLWLRFNLQRPMRPKPGFAAALVALALTQIAAGGLVAGLDAGQGYNTWPLMDGALLPQGLGAMRPWWLNLFENALTVQFDHRLLAYVLLALAAWQVWRWRDVAATLLLAALVLQAVLGIATLLWHVPLTLALAHQFGALLALAAAMWHLRQRSM